MADASVPLIVLPHEGQAAPGPGDRSTIKIPAAATAGRLLLREYCFDPGVGPPLHRHEREDEIFWVLEGEVTFLIDGRRAVLAPGSCILAPRGRPHTFRNTGAVAAGMIAIATPGENFERFCRKFSALTAGTADARDVQRLGGEICARHGIEILSPNPL